MKRKGFLEKLDVGVAFALTSTCLGACSSSSTDTPAPTSTKVDFTLDLSETQYSFLTNEPYGKGKYIVRNGVVIARSTGGSYHAATQKCSHQNLNEVICSDEKWVCNAHGTQLNKMTGDGLNDNGSNGLTTYKTELTDKKIRVYEL